ncbi:MAG: cytochrome c3 family protein [Anaerolineae bacterium]|nr:cytochrome c3 family protein [Anaerolineae bacterium]
MTIPKLITSYSLSILKVFSVGLILVCIGLILLSDVQAQDTAATDEAPVARYTSIFDSAPQTNPTIQPTTTPAVPVPSPTEAAVPGVQVTRYTSIFDQPAATQDSAAVGATSVPTADGLPTRMPSIFDTQPQAQPTVQPGQATVAPYTSIFDTVQSDTIRYEGEDLPDRAYCLSCHENPYLQMQLASGETISVTFDEEAYRASVHGQHGTEGYRCVRCHADMNEYPHPEVTAQTARELTIEFSTSCARCHADKYDETLDGLHAALLASGEENAAVCSDCHSGHAVQPLTDADTHEHLLNAGLTSVEMCKSCHAEIYDRYTTSVHGSALLEGNQDVPTCADCHGVHNTKGPSDSSFRLFSPQTCATCHADEALMAKYEISTDVFETYVADFHGTTVSIFQNTAPDQPFNAPVCVDCHGVHDIMAVDSESSPLLKDNLVSVCQRCHPDATTSFPDAWLSHYQPSFERTPWVAFANAAYGIAIPAVIGGLGLFVASDARRRRRSHKREKDS